jgi:hypothetical protein
MRGPWLKSSLDAGSRPSHGMVCSSGLIDWGPCVFLFTPFDLYRVIQEETLIYVEVLVKFLCVQFWMGTEMELFESPDLMPLDFLLWTWFDCGSGWRAKFTKETVDTADELLARILDAAACIKKREDQLRRTTSDLRTRVAKWTEADSGIFERLLWTVTNLSFNH